MGDYKKSHGKRIIEHYREVIGEDLFPAFRGLEKDKRDPVTGLTNLSDWISSINKVTGRPRFRINIRCNESIKEHMHIRWKASKEMSSSREGVTLGADHCVDPNRYAVQSGLLNNGLLYKKFGPKDKRDKEKPFDDIYY